MSDLQQILKLSSEMISRSVLATGADTASLSYIQLDSDYMVASYKDNENIIWVSEEEKTKALEEGIVWSLFYSSTNTAGNNWHASSLEAIMMKINKLDMPKKSSLILPDSGLIKPN